MFAVRSGPPPRHPFIAPINWHPPPAGTTSKPVLVPSSIVAGGSLLPAPICPDSDSDDIHPGYPAARQLFPLPNPAPAPTTLDPRSVFTRDLSTFAYDAADSGDDANIDSPVDNEDGADDDSVNNGPPSSAGVDTDSVIDVSDDDNFTDVSDNDSAVIINDDDYADIDDDYYADIDDYYADIDDDYADISLSDRATFDHNNCDMPALRITTNPATPPSATSSLMVEDGSDSDLGVFLY